MLAENVEHHSPQSAPCGPADGVRHLGDESHLFCREETSEPVIGQFAGLVQIPDAGKVKYHKVKSMAGKATPNLKKRRETLLGAVLTPR